MTIEPTRHTLYQALDQYQTACYVRGLRALDAADSRTPQYRRAQFFEALDAVIAARAAFTEHSHQLEQTLATLEQRGQSEH